jgi:hypothetical protein
MGIEEMVEERGQVLSIVTRISGTGREKAVKFGRR